jgi:enterochelin esterase-like enzyme
MPIIDWGWWESPNLPPRPITLWLPETVTYPLCVLYAHDGQNLFRPETAFAGVDWNLHNTLQDLIDKGQARSTLVVGIGNTPERMHEYAPGPKGNAYLRFLTDQLRPRLQEEFPISLDPSDHFLMGSSMGGIISAYMMCKLPEQFGGAACLSTHWPWHNGEMVHWMRRNLIPPGHHRWYFDWGTETADAPYRPYQEEMDEILTQRGYRRGKDWETLNFPGHDHSEGSWRSRVHLPLRFLLF